MLTDVARLVGTSTDDLVPGVQRRLDEIKALQDEVKALRSQLASGRADELAAAAVDGVVVTRIDGLSPNDLRELALAVRQQPGVDVVVLGRRQRHRRRVARQRRHPGVRAGWPAT